MNRTAKEQKEYYRNNPYIYKRHLKKANKYIKTEKGRKLNTLALRRFVKRHPDYYKVYRKKDYKRRKKKGICVYCGKRKREKPYVGCKKCREYYKEHRER